MLSKKVYAPAVVPPNDAILNYQALLPIKYVQAADVANVLFAVCQAKNGVLPKSFVPPDSLRSLIETFMSLAVSLEAKYSSDKEGSV